jgi:hypothetical protein
MNGVKAAAAAAAGSVGIGGSALSAKRRSNGVKANNEQSAGEKRIEIEAQWNEMAAKWNRKLLSMKRNTI